VSEEDARRRAAALEALKEKRAPAPAARSFWERNGFRVLVVAGLVLALALIARAVGSFMRSSISETSRAEQELRKGMR
jgi:hypothetical protein